MMFESTHPGRLRIMVGAAGPIFTVAGVVTLTPLFALIAYPREGSSWPEFLLPALVLLIVGLLFWWSSPQPVARFTIIDGAMTIVFSWAVVCLVSSYPIEQLGHLTFTQAVFVSVSGWTTTGLSVVDVTTAPKVLLLWLSIMQLAGGAGLAIIMLAAFSLPIGAGLYRAEGRSDQLVPNVIRSTKLVVMLYSVYAAAGIMAYRLAGMDLFDAINQSFAAVSTGGFSTKADSIGYWNSPTIEAITIVLMLLGNLNFASAYALFRGKISAFLKNGETKVLGLMMLLGITAVFFLVTKSLYTPLSKSVRVAVFDTISALTTTGFSTESYTNWPPAGYLVFIVLMLIGGGACSTAGGIKQFRIYLLFKSALWDVKRMMLPRRAVVEHSVWQGEERIFIPPETIRAVGTFVFLYLALFFIGTFVLAAYGYPLRESMFEFSSALGTVGLSVGVTSTATPPGALWTETLGMFLGRLEIIVVFIFVAQFGKGVRGLFRRRKRTVGLQSR